MTPRDVFRRTDWDLLEKQKRAVEEALPDSDDARGIATWIENLMDGRSVGSLRSEPAPGSECKRLGCGVWETMNAETLAVYSYLTTNVDEKIEAQAIAETVKRDHPLLLGFELAAEIGLSIRHWLTEEHRKELHEDELNFVGRLAQIALQGVEWHLLGWCFRWCAVMDLSHRDG
jgi:hypothetical protein